MIRTFVYQIFYGCYEIYNLQNESEYCKCDVLNSFEQKTVTSQFTFTKVCNRMSLESSYSNIIQVCKVLVEQNDLKVTVEESGKGALMAAFGAFCGGVLGGPVGLGIGGTVGSICGMMHGKGKYKSVLTIINEMPPNQQQRLAQAVHRCFDDVSITDVATLLAMVAANASLKELILREISTFIFKEMNKMVM